MELSNNGRLILLLGTTLLIVGFLFSNTLVLVPAALMFLYLVHNGISFHRSVSVFRDSIKLEDHPSTTEIPVGYWFKIESTLNNSSSQDFRIIRFSHELPTEFDEQGRAPESLSLPSHGKLRLENSLKTKISGRFKITASIIVFEIQRRLFRQSVRLPCDVTAIARPLFEKTGPSFDATVLYDLATDTLRRGQGTDLAGIRPSTPMDDFHRIDWKATARTGKFMTRESYLERDPSIVLMIDLSSSTKNTRSNVSARDVLLSELAKLLATVRLATPIGLILYDERNIITNVQPSLGVENRERILGTLLEKAKPTSAPGPLERGATRSYPDLARETNSLMRESAFAAKTKAYWKQFSSFASFILPFYERAESKYFERVRRQGAFKVFEIICTFPEPVLVIAISDDETNLDGLAEGAKNARIVGHQIVLAILAAPKPEKGIEILSDLEGQGVGILRCSPEELSRAINAGVLNLSHSRTIPAEGHRRGPRALRQN